MSFGELSYEVYPSGALAALADVGGDAVERVAARSLTVSLRPRAAWIMTAAADAALLAVDDGFLVLSSDIGNGNDHGGRYVALNRRIILATGQAGTFLAPPGVGERVEALTACRFTVISGDSLKALTAVPPVAEAITIALAQELRERHATIRNCAYVRHSDRVREKLLQLARVYGRVVPGGVRIDFPLTHQVLADMVGSARETVSLAITELVRDGFVGRQDRSYVLRVASSDLLPATGADAELALVR